jgi:hypothetical protein
MNLMSEIIFTMTTSDDKNGKSRLEQIARRVMQSNGFLPDFSAAASNK